jgi:hypothetical protein
MSRLYSEWEGAPVRKIKLLPGWNVRDRVLTPDDEEAYFAVASPLVGGLPTLKLE